MEIYLKLLSNLVICTQKLFENMNKICADADIHEINAHQIFILCHMKPERKYSVAELAKIYPFSNISYNLNNLCKCGYIIKEPSTTDLRLTVTDLTEKGEKLLNLIKDKLKEHRFNSKQNFIKEINTLTKEMNSL